MVDRHRVVFLPGASGTGQFWAPVAALLPESWDRMLVDLPGLGDVPADPRVRAFDDLVTLVLTTITEPIDLVAQSMGGVIAINVALARPDAVRSLVLTATSGGVDLSTYGVEDWRQDYRAEFPNAAAFVTAPYPRDLSDQLGDVRAPSLLLWADRDPISPVAIGQYLESKLPRAKLVVLEHEGHSFGRDRADLVAPLIQNHLEEEDPARIRGAC
jgi:pimeloyl-ACP methyl ester carboxylesterase